MEYQTDNRAYGKVTCRKYGVQGENGAVRAFRPYEHVYGEPETEQTPTDTENFRRRSLAMVYPERQMWGETHTIDGALKTGTLFKSLDLPFLAGGCTQRGGFVR